MAFQLTPASTAPKLLSLILNRALIREVTITSVGVSLIITGILLVVRLVGLLSKAAEGTVPIDSVIGLLTLKMVSYIDLIIPLMVYVAILMVMNRWHRDNELVVWGACGVGLGSLMRPLVIFAALITAIVAVFSFYFSPFSVAQAQALEEEAKARKEITGIAPGAFHPLQGGSGVYYIEGLGEGKNSLQDVFVYMRESRNEGTIVANNAYQGIDDNTNARYLVLENGRRYDGGPGDSDFTIMKYASYAIRIKNAKAIEITPRVKGIPTLDLMKSDDPEKKVELHWRIAKVAVVPILVIFALAFSHITVRKSRFSNMLTALATYFMYANMLVVGKSMMEKDSTPLWLGLWWVHALFLLAALYLFWRFSNNLPLFSFRSRKQTDDVCEGLEL